MLLLMVIVTMMAHHDKVRAQLHHTAGAFSFSLPWKSQDPVNTQLQYPAENQVDGHGIAWATG